MTFTVWAPGVEPRSVEAKSKLAARRAFLVRAGTATLASVRAVPARYVLVRFEQHATRSVWHAIIDTAASSADRVVVVAEFRGRGSSRRAAAMLAGILRAEAAGAESQTATRARNQEWRIVSRPICANTAPMQRLGRGSSLKAAISSDALPLGARGAAPDVRNPRG